MTVIYVCRLFTLVKCNIPSWQKAYVTIEDQRYACMYVSVQYIYHHDVI